MNNNCAPRRLEWACRRGMLELDLWLGSFLKDVWPSLSVEQKKAFEIMLEEADPIIFGWLTRQDEPKDFATCSLVRIIREHVRL